ncbi:response regulator [Streptomyces sp. NPDC001401]|uniref:response regulator n=1 Tax=Streptomyces sp. NPDC001401 TaxID=3364570 RepID=UPI003679A000
MVEILVVDDNQRAGRAFARLIQAETGLETVYTNSPEEAVNVAKANHLKVAVLDQRMPLKLGTDLFLELASIEPDLRGILFSGKVEADDLEEAMRNKFCDFVNKDKVAELSERVREHYFEALADIAKRRSENPIALSNYRSGFSLRGPRVHLELISITESPEDIWVEEDFRTFMKVDIGGTKREVNTTRRELEVVIEQESISKLSSNAEFKFEVMSKLQSTVEHSRRKNYKRRASHAIEKAAEETYTLESNPAAGNGSVRSRHLQAAPIYRRVKLLLRTQCDCCGSMKNEAVYALVPTGDLRTRQIDYLSNNTQAIFDTGTINGY